MPSPVVERFLSRLDKVRKSGAGWTAPCPAHDDRNPSLSVKEGANGCVLVKCFAGCSVDSICAALGLRMADLFPGSGRRAQR